MTSSTGSGKMPKIAWIVDEPNYLGGAELEVLYLLRTSPDRYKNVMVRPGGHIHRDIDLVMVHNCTQWDADLIDQLQGKKIIKRVHDMWPHGDPELREYLLTHSNMVMMSSPLHREHFPHAIKAKKVVDVPSALDANRFLNNRDKFERKGTVWAGRMYLGKGLDRAAEWARQNNEPVSVFGYGPLRDKLRNPLQYIGEVEHDAVDLLYPRFERFLFLPDQIEPFGRTAVEAWLSGCELVINGRVGAKWWMDNQPETLKHGATYYWNKVSKTC
jgi:hypothetical protein